MWGKLGLVLMGGAILSKSLIQTCWVGLCSLTVVWPEATETPSHRQVGSVSHWPPKSNSLGFLSLLLGPQVGKSIAGPRTFLTVREFIWHNCSAVCGLSARWLHGGASGDLLQQGFCHRLCDPGLPQPEPLSPWQVTGDPCLRRRHSNTQRQLWISLYGASGPRCANAIVVQLLAMLLVSASL